MGHRRPTTEEKEGERRVKRRGNKSQRGGGEDGVGESHKIPKLQFRHHPPSSSSLPSRKGLFPRFCSLSQKAEGGRRRRSLSSSSSVRLLLGGGGGGGGGAIPSGRFRCRRSGLGSRVMQFRIHPSQEATKFLLSSIDLRLFAFLFLRGIWYFCRRRNGFRHFCLVQSVCRQKYFICAVIFCQISPDVRLVNLIF